MKKLLASIVLVAATASSAFATTIINQDNKAYKLTILDGSVTSTKDVGSRVSLYGLCGSASCKFTIKGSTIVAGKDETLLLNGGKLKKM